jgi:hypothetical protein
LKKRLEVISSFLLFFPSVTFSLLKSEIFPWAFLISQKSNSKIYSKLIPLYLLFIFSIFYTLFITDFTVDKIEILRSLIAYLNPLLIFLFLIYNKKYIVTNYLKTIKVIFISFIIFGFIQYSGLLANFENFFRIFIPRLYMQKIGGGRGVTIFSSEPSRASYEFLFLYIFLRQFIIKNKYFLYDLLYLSFSLLIIKSATGILLSALYFLIVYKKRIPIIITFFIIIGLILINSFSDNRSFVILATLLNRLTKLDFGTAFYFILNESGYRLISIIGAYSYGIITFIGTGIGNWEIGISNAIKFLEINPSSIVIYNTIDGSNFVSTRPTAFLASYILDFGLLGFFILAYSFNSTIKLILPFIPKKLSITFLIYIFFVGDIGNPIPWIIMALTFRFNKLSNDKESV